MIKEMILTYMVRSLYVCVKTKITLHANIYVIGNHIHKINGQRIP